MKPFSTLFLFPLVVLFSLSLNAEDSITTDSPALVWRDAQTKKILFTSDDIISFDWDKQVFLLKTDAILDFLAWIPPHMHQYKSLFVEDADGVIYNANWVSDESSMGFFGPIYNPLSPNPLFSIEDSYPSRSRIRSTENDLRFNDRLREGLKKAGVLNSIDINRNYIGLTIQTTGHLWKDVGEDLKVRVEYFENTFLIDDKARAHIFFAGGEKTVKKIDFLALGIVLVANKGTFRSEITIENIPASIIEDGLYVCKFDFRQPVEGSDEDIKNGSCSVLLSVLLKKEENGKNKTVYRLDFPESDNIPVVGKQ